MSPPSLRHQHNQQVHTSTYTTSYPIYSSYPTVYHRSMPFVAHKRLVTGTRILSSPVRIVSSPVRLVRSVPSVRVVTSPIRVLNVRSSRQPSSALLNREYSKVRSHPHYYATENYLNSSSVKVNTHNIYPQKRATSNNTQTTLRECAANAATTHAHSMVAYSKRSCVHVRNIAAWHTCTAPTQNVNEISWHRHVCQAPNQHKRDTNTNR